MYSRLKRAELVSPGPAKKAWKEVSFSDQNIFGTVRTSSCQKTAATGYFWEGTALGRAMRESLWREPHCGMPVHKTFHSTGLFVSCVYKSQFLCVWAFVYWSVWLSSPIGGCQTQPIVLYGWQKPIANLLTVVMGNSYVCVKTRWMKLNAMFDIF